MGSLKQQARIIPPEAVGEPGSRAMVELTPQQADELRIKLIGAADEAQRLLRFAQMMVEHCEAEPPPEPVRYHDDSRPLAQARRELEKISVRARQIAEFSATAHGESVTTYLARFVDYCLGSGGHLSAMKWHMEILLSICIDK